MTNYYLISNLSKSTKIEALPGSPLFKQGTIYGPISESAKVKLLDDPQFSELYSSRFISIRSNTAPVPAKPEKVITKVEEPVVVEEPVAVEEPVVEIIPEPEEKPTTKKRTRRARKTTAKKGE